MWLLEDKDATRRAAARAQSRRNQLAVAILLIFLTTFIFLLISLTVYYDYTLSRQVNSENSTDPVTMVTPEETPPQPTEEQGTIPPWLRVGGANNATTEIPPKITTSITISISSDRPTAVEIGTKPRTTEQQQQPAVTSKPLDRKDVTTEPREKDPTEPLFTEPLPEMVRQEFGEGLTRRYYGRGDEEPTSAGGGVVVVITDGK